MMPLFFLGHTAVWGEHRNAPVNLTTFVETCAQKLWKDMERCGGFTISNSKTTCVHCMHQFGASTNIECRNLLGLTIPQKTDPLMDPASSHNALTATVLPLLMALSSLFPSAGIAAVRTGLNNKKVRTICTPGMTRFKAATKIDPPSKAKKRTDISAWGTFSINRWARLLFVTCL